MDKNIWLSTAAHAMNTIVGSDGLTTSLLLFGASTGCHYPTFTQWDPRRELDLEP